MALDLAALARPPAADGLPPERSTAALTYVELVWIVDRRRRVLSYAPGAVFAFVRWAANERGTVLSRLDILQAAAPGAVCSTVPGVAPGGHILLRLSGWPNVRRGLEAIDAVEDSGVEPTDVAPDWWGHVHHRITAGEPVRAYTRERHRAWLLRRELLP